MYSRRDLLSGLVAVGGLGVLAGCSDVPGLDGESPDGGQGFDDAPTVVVTEHPEYSQILTDAEGSVLYQWTQDAPRESNCLEACTEDWPPLTVDGEPTAGDDVGATVDTIRRPDGERQVTAAEWPLYYFANDDEPGEASGQGVNEAWFVVDPGGKPIGSGQDPASGEFEDPGLGGYEGNETNESNDSEP